MCLMKNYQEKILEYERALENCPLGKWYRFESVDNEALLRALVEDYHQKGIIEFEFSNDFTRFRKVMEWYKYESSQPKI